MIILHIITQPARSFPYLEPVIVQCLVHVLQEPVILVQAALLAFVYLEVGVVLAVVLGELAHVVQV